MTGNKITYDKAKFREAIAESGKHMLDRITAAAFKTVFAKMPVEEYGHGHNCFATALKQTGLPKCVSLADAVLTGPKVQRPDDRQALQAAVGQYKQTKHNLHVTVSARLPYLDVLENGGVLRPSVRGNSGRKIQGLNTLGELYAARYNDGHGGRLYFKRNGQWIFATSREVSGKRFLAAGVEAARSLASKLGLSK